MTRAPLAVGALAVVAAGCGGGGESARHKYPAAVTTNYMASCVKSTKTTRAYCACTLDKLSESVSTKDFERIGRSGGQIPQRIRALITKAAHDCRDKL